MAIGALRGARTALLLLAVLVLPATGRPQSPDSDEAAAYRVLDDQMAAYNASDERAWLAALFFPHVRISGDAVRVFPNAESYLRELSFKQHGWDYSRWTDRRTVQSGPGKVHVVATFTRYRANHTPVDSYSALYVIVLRNGRWGIVARSSFAP
jgi:hypothetical protein